MPRIDDIVKKGKTKKPFKKNDVRSWDSNLLQKLKIDTSSGDNFPDETKPEKRHTTKKASLPLPEKNQTVKTTQSVSSNKVKDQAYTTETTRLTQKTLPPQTPNNQKTPSIDVIKKGTAVTPPLEDEAVHNKKKSYQHPSNTTTSPGQGDPVKSTASLEYADNNESAIQALEPALFQQTTASPGQGDPVKETRSTVNIDTDEFAPKPFEPVFSQQLKPELNYRQAIIYHCLLEIQGKPTTTKRLAEITKIKQQSVRTIIKRLDALGLISRKTKRIHATNTFIAIIESKNISYNSHGDKQALFTFLGSINMQKLIISSDYENEPSLVTQNSIKSSSTAAMTHTVEEEQQRLAADIERIKQLKALRAQRAQVQKELQFQEMLSDPSSTAYQWCYRNLPKEIQDNEHNYPDAWETAMQEQFNAWLLNASNPPN